MPRCVHYLSGLYTKSGGGDFPERSEEIGVGVDPIQRNERTIKRR
jgi:hypothetical protein